MFQRKIEKSSREEQTKHPKRVGEQQSSPIPSSGWEIFVGEQRREGGRATNQSSGEASCMQCQRITSSCWTTGGPLQLLLALLVGEQSTEGDRLSARVFTRRRFYYLKDEPARHYRTRLCISPAHVCVDEEH